MYTRNVFSENKEIFYGKGMKNKKVGKLHSFISSQVYLQIWLIFLLEMDSPNINISIGIFRLHKTGMNSGYFEQKQKFIKKIELLSDSKEE